MSITPKPYTDDDNTFLHQHYHLIGPTACSQQLGRTYPSIVTQAYRLGLKSNKFRISSSSLTKVCGRCQQEKAKNCFGTDKQRKDRLHPICKTCLQKNRASKAQQKSHYDKAYRTANIDKIKHYVQTNRIKIRARTTQYRRRWRQIPHNRILQNLRTRLRKALKNKHKIFHTVELLGCSVLDFKAYLESRFTLGMTWQNYGKGGWHIDHIKPCSNFDLTDPQQQKECFHYTNMQPLWEKDNLSKGGK